MTDPQPTRWDTVWTIHELTIADDGTADAIMEGANVDMDESPIQIVLLFEAEAKVRHYIEKWRETAARVEEVQAERDEARAMADRSDGAHARELKARVKAEARIEQLEGALERIADHEPPFSIGTLRGIAREALASTPQPSENPEHDQMMRRMSERESAQPSEGEESAETPKTGS